MPTMLDITKPSSMSKAAKSTDDTNADKAARNMGKVVMLGTTMAMKVAATANSRPYC
ncbi:hypothetical protein JCM19239_5686 [Vibrio variabilis]|uniref:Uncharacterized protein n=1 Tax=Vibrio variabilis TaxID=990271 RepID=A0ABQ0JM93_9VIBR|nr:hypothetical protein JCM19239_5686 [Vibrio variabilis]